MHLSFYKSHWSLGIGPIIPQIFLNAGTLVISMDLTCSLPNSYVKVLLSNVMAFASEAFEK
jgi:hypothetical protein